MRRLALFAQLAALVLPALAGDGFRWRAEIADEIHRPDAPEANSMGGITWVSNNVYWAVTDEKFKPVVWELELPVDSVTGKLSFCKMHILSRPEGAIDVEGLARDPLDGSLWLADERDCTIKRCDPLTGRRLEGDVEVPPVMKGFVKEFGIESLAISRDGLTMWSCLEEASSYDGPLSTRRRGSSVRLVRFSREAVGKPWRAVGQWLYCTDPIAGKSWHNEKGEDMSRSGVSELCVMDDGTLLVLEREFSVVLVPRFRCRLYETDLSAATDVSAVPSLRGATKLKAAEKRLLCETTGFAMYEGMCVGPTLADGSRVLMMVSDGDEKSFRAVLSIRLTPR